MTPTVSVRTLVAPATIALALAFSVVACAQSTPDSAGEGQPLGPSTPPDGLAFATFAGGCFWCMEPPFDKLEGVTDTISGYSGGEEKHPTYKQVSRGRTGHAEVVRVVYDPTRIRYEDLVDVFWRNVDPTVSDRQFCDWGRQYRTAIFYHDEAQRGVAERTREAIDSAGTLPGPVVTEIVAAGDFYPAEEYHQDFYTKNPSHYSTYRTGCGRDQRLRELWGDASE
jgi:peptide-methionine (S)-S-oxide reductase